MSNYERKALNGETPSREDALEMFADPTNWVGIYPPDMKPRAKVWAWVGPVIPPWEAAQIALKES